MVGMGYWKVVKETGIDKADETLKAYRWMRFDHPIQYRPDDKGELGERIQAMDEKTDKVSFMVENRAQFVSGVHVYFEPDMVSKIFAPFWKEQNPPDGRVLSELDHGYTNIDYHIHCDPAVVNDMFSVMVAHSEEAPEPDEFGIMYNHVIVDNYTVYRPSDFKDGMISYSAVMDDLKILLQKFRPSTLSMDQFNSAMLLQELQTYCGSINLRCNVYEENATNTKNLSMYESLKFSINNGLIHSYKDSLNRSDDSACLFERMLDEIQYVDGKIVKPRSQQYGHCDLVDCIAVLNQLLVGNQREARDKAIVRSAFIPNSEVNRQDGSFDALARKFHSNSPFGSLY